MLVNSANTLREPTGIGLESNGGIEYLFVWDGLMLLMTAPLARRRNLGFSWLRVDDEWEVEGERCQEICVSYRGETAIFSKICWAQARNVTSER